jgi:adenylate kinase
MEAGTLVPDSVVIGLVKERIQQKDAAKGFMLDGFPRNVSQAETLDKMLGELNLKIDHVVSVEVPSKELLGRLTGRRTCRNCNAMFHVMFNPPKKDGVCDKCSGELYQRADDNEATVSSRLKVYDEQTAPLIDYYSKQGKVRTIDGVGEISSIYAKIKAVLG